MVSYRCEHPNTMSLCRPDVVHDDKENEGRKQDSKNNSFCEGIHLARREHCGDKNGGKKGKLRLKHCGFLAAIAAVPQ
jgi:hypothetical protein